MFMDIKDKNSLPYKKSSLTNFEFANNKYDVDKNIIKWKNNVKDNKLFEM